ncbi:MAG: class I SAM-dependent DNA methyltransferase [Verrucomicrobia bacterium]|nr:MAG: class I SAM-dependent DNA methyltransferase [Verrucomicrobiota bacterium]
MVSDTQRSIEAHKRWLGYLQPDGLVVSAAALVDKGHYYNEGQRARQIEFSDHLSSFQKYDEEEGTVEITDFKALATNFLGWPEREWVAAADLGDDFHIRLKESHETLSPTAALRWPRGKELADGEKPYQLLIWELPAEINGKSVDFDTSYEVIQNTWSTNATRRMERLLRETGVPIGLLVSATGLRLIYAPVGENPGSLTFQFADMLSTMGRPILGAFDLLLGVEMLFLGEESHQLPALLKHSRDMQANVSVELARQVLDGLYDLIRGTQAADARTGGKLLRHLLATKPNLIYEGQLNVLMRLVFLLFAEDRGLMPNSELYNRHYSIHSLYERLRLDDSIDHENMDARYGAWAQLLALFRLVFHGHRHQDLQLPARYGYLFDPNRFPFLEGRYTDSNNQESTIENPQSEIPLIPDGTIFRLLKRLLFLNGERISYRTLDVEQIGSVYETMMGFGLTRAKGRTIAIRPQKKHGAPVNLDLDHVLSLKGADRHKHFTDETGRALTGARLTAFNTATTVEELLAALQGTTANSNLVAVNATPHLAQPDSILLQPTDTRRKSGSHYTPRKLTEPIVRKALEPILASLGEQPFPAQILDLKVCDPAVGSGAFLVEACRQLADALVKAWAAHGGKPIIPPDEDEVLHARRLVAQRCLYGVDRNPMAADLTKLSLWLATLAKDHPFTFLDHAIRSGDSLVGLSKKQILAFHWDLTHPSAKQRVFGQDVLEKKIKAALAYRQEILNAGDLVLPELKAAQLNLAEQEIDKVRRAGDLAVLGFFSGSKPKERQEARDLFLERWLKATDQSGSEESIREGIALKREIRQARESEKPVVPFHWEVEFPEVFERSNPGFDIFVGNPPFVGGMIISRISGNEYRDWLYSAYEGAGNRMDLVAYFLRTAFSKLRDGGAMGMIATNTIAQGDTRTGGLRSIRLNGGTIFAALRRYQWPGEAAVVVSVLHIAKGSINPPYSLDGKPTTTITSYLFKDGGDDAPHALSKNKRISNIGANVLGMGFTFDIEDRDGKCGTIEEMNQLIQADPRNGELIKPFIGGDEINSNPDHSHRRFIIDFGDRTEAEAKAFPELYRIVRERVKPQRDKAKRDAYRKYWWRFGERQTSLYSSISGISTVLVTCLVTKHLSFSRVTSKQVFSHKLAVFSDSSFARFSTLQSRAHDFWARAFCSTLEDRLNYSPTDAFETFPFPENWESDERLEEIGREYYDYRAELMVRNDEGLTNTYNRFHDPEEKSPAIQKLRELHAAMDRAVIDAYGWDIKDEDLVCEFIPDFSEEDDDGNEIPKNIRYRWRDEVRDDILARLLALNAERYQAEVNAGLHSKGATKPKAAKKAAKKAATPRKVKQPEPVLFGLQEKPWLDAIQAFTVEVPTDSRPSLGTALGYYRLLIPTLTQEAGGSIPLQLLVAAATLLEDRDSLLAAVDGLSEGAKKRWRVRFKENPDAGMFREALRSLAVDSRRIRIVGPKGEYEVRDQPGDPIKSPWIIADARLLLKAAVALEAQGSATEISSEVIEEIAAQTRTA